MTQYIVAEKVVQSRETREDLPNEDVVTLPVVDGPFDTFEEAEAEADEEQYVALAVPDEY